MKIYKSFLLLVILLLAFTTNAGAWEFTFKNESKQTLTWQVYGSQWGTKAYRCTIITGPNQTGPQDCQMPWGEWPLAAVTVISTRFYCGENICHTPYQDLQAKCGGPWNCSVTIYDKLNPMEGIGINIMKY